MRHAATQYEPLGPLLSAGERDFYFVLVEAVKGKNLVFAKVRLGDIVTLKKYPRENALYWQGMKLIYQRQVDFVIVNSETLEVVVVVELDDKSHMRAKQIKRDAQLNAILYGARIPIARIKAASRYNVPDLLVDLREPWLAMNDEKKRLTRPF